jgi:hypothetical protein
MKKLLFSLILFVAYFPTYAQEGDREEFHDLSDLKMTAYSFEDGSRFFVFFGRPTTSVSGVEKGSFDQTDVYFSGDEAESATFLEKIHEFNLRTVESDNAVLKIGDLFIHRVSPWLSKKASSIYWTGKGSISVRDRNFDQLYEEFKKYNTNKNGKIQ